MTTIPLGGVAPISRRVIAYIIDALIAGVLPVLAMIVTVTLTVGALQNPESAAGAMLSVAVASGVFGLLMLAWFVVYTLMQTGRGSIGMRAQRIRLVGADDLAPISFWRALLRNVVFAVTGAFVVGMFSPLFDGSGRYQGWHDKVGGAVMLDAAAVPARDAAAPATAADLPLPSPPAAGGRTGFATPPATPAPGAAPSAVRLPDAVDETVVAPRPSPAAAPQPAGAVAAEQTIAAPRPGSDASGDPLISFVPGVTQPGTPAAAAPPAPPSAPAPVAQPAAVAQPAPVAPAAPASAHADDDVESTRISIPGHRLVFTWDDGQRVTVSGRTVFGRNPEQEPGAVVISVRDETLSLSKTHFEAASAPSGGWIMDRQSTNGTVVVREGVRIACPPGQRVPVRLGDAVEIGDRILTIGGFA